MEKLKGIITPVLDHGSIELIDWMGDDSDIVKAARISTGASTKTTLEDERLIDYLVEHEHTSPFEMCEIKFKITMPIFIARQWMRHRMASINEFSGRYSEMKDEFYVPEKFRLQSNLNHQGSDGLLNADLNHLYKDHLVASNQQTFEQYRKMLDSNVSREMSRIVLPLSTYTSFFWKIDLHNLLKFLRLRMDPTAQVEIRVYADELWRIVQLWVPSTAKSFENHYLKSFKLSFAEYQVVQKAIKDIDPTTMQQIKNTIESSLEIKKRHKDKLLNFLFEYKNL
jgi:thymidylate synthase (FAD)